jgi:hypothetical protein
MTTKRNQEIEEIVKQILIFQQDKANKSASETVSNLFKTLDEKLDVMAKNFDDRLEKLEQSTQWINDTFAGGKLLSRISTFIVKFLITVTAISGAILWLKDWLKK